MAIEWLASWGIQTAVGFLFKPVMEKFAEDLGKDLLKDILKDVIKGLPSNILHSLEKEDIDKAVGKAIKEFLETLQNELLIALSQELAGNFKDDPDTLPILKQRAQTDDEGYVRSAAVQALARNYKHEVGVLGLFCNVAVNDPFQPSKEKLIMRSIITNPRQTALEVILKHYPNYPQILPLLSDRSENDPDENLRKWAKSKLGMK